MKGQYVFDVKNLPEIAALVVAKAINDFGCEDKTKTIMDETSLVFVDLDSRTIKSASAEYSEYKANYGFGGYSPELSVVQFLRLERPVPQVALALVITDDLSEAAKSEQAPRMVTAEDMAKFNFAVTRDHVMEAAEQACSALGV